MTKDELKLTVNSMVYVIMTTVSIVVIMALIVFGGHVIGYCE